MARFERNTAVPKNCGGSYHPPEVMPPGGMQPEPFKLKEKILDMLKYGLPIVKTFPRRDKELADEMKKAMLEMDALANRLALKYTKKTTLEEMDIQLANLRDFIIIASDRAYSGPKYPPPMSQNQREVWGRYNSEIGRIIGGYKKYVDSKK